MMKPNTRGFAARQRWRPVLAVAALVAGAGFAAAPAQVATAVTGSPSICPGANVAAFGPDVCVFNDTMSQATIQNDLNSIASQQVAVASQFDSQRYAVLFQPGTYGSASNPLVFQVGYYTQVAGLGAMPQDTVINGAIDVFNNLCNSPALLSVGLPGLGGSSTDPDVIQDVYFRVGGAETTPVSATVTTCPARPPGWIKGQARPRTATPRS